MAAPWPCDTIVSIVRGLLVETAEVVRWFYLSLARSLAIFLAALEPKGAWGDTSIFLISITWIKMVQIRETYWAILVSNWAMYIGASHLSLLVEWVPSLHSGLVNKVPVVILTAVQVPAGGHSVTHNLLKTAQKPSTPRVEMFPPYFWTSALITSESENLPIKRKLIIVTFFR